MNDKGFDPAYDDNKKVDSIYFGNRNMGYGNYYRKCEVIFEPKETFLSEKNSESKNEPTDFKINDIIILHESPGGQQKIHCWLIESNDNKAMQAIHISRRTKKGVYGSQEVTLLPSEALKLKKFLDTIIHNNSISDYRFNVDIDSLNEDNVTLISNDEFLKIIQKNISSTDDFYNLLSLQKMRIAVKELENIINGNYKNEVEIQKFLKKNIWMFGNNYSQIVEDGKINAKNIMDIVPENIESFIDIIEVKLPNEELFRLDQSHNNYYASSKLTKAIAQTQNYIFELEQKSVDFEYQNKNNCKIIKPRGIVLIGSKEQLNENEQRYLRVMNSSYHNIQVMTYQQLLQQANNSLSFFDNKE